MFGLSRSDKINKVKAEIDGVRSQMFHLRQREQALLFELQRLMGD